MRRIVICSFVALLLAGLIGSAADTKPLRASASITEASIRGHMEFLASDAMNGRGSGTHDEWVTATYIASNLRRWGIEPLGDVGQHPARMTDAIQSMWTPVLYLLNSTFKPDWLPGGKPGGGTD